MSCDLCGSRCVGRICAACTRIESAENAVVDDELYECPSCGESSSGPATDCYRCRGGE